MQKTKRVKREISKYIFLFTRALSKKRKKLKIHEIKSIGKIFTELEIIVIKSANLDNLSSIFSCFIYIFNDYY